MEGYQFVNELYSGSRSKLIHAKKISSDEPVVFKTHINVYPTNETIDRLRHEFDIAEQLQSNHVTKYFAIREYDKGILIIREYGNYQSLESYINKKLSLQPITIYEFLNIAIQLASGLVDIHKREIVHNGIHPKNILIDSKANVIKYTDFALSCLGNYKPSINDKSIRDLYKLSYISPEKTGRIHKVVDQRSDLYSLGVIFYHLLTGTTPFKHAEAITMIRAHIAKIPMAPMKLNKHIPKAINDLILVLLDKNPNQRYQTSVNLLKDLLSCQTSLMKHKQVQSIQLTHSDRQQLFKISSKLYGREQQILELKNALSRINPKGIEIILVSGYSGIGKTSLIQSIHEDLLNRSGRYIIGKFIQSQNVTYGALNQAFQGLIREILSENDDIIAYWKNKILNAVGNNGQIIIQVVPDIELIIGKQNPVNILSPEDNEKRFNHVFLDFLCVFSNTQHPLVLFLDDLQWADPGTIKFLQQVILTDKPLSLLIIGAYRDNEIDFNDSAKKVLENFHASKVKVTEFELAPLSITNICHLLTDTLHLPINEVKDFAGVLHEKTGGNPFFIKSLLKYLYGEGKIYFSKQNKWSWDIDEIRSEKVSDNIAELVLNRVHKLTAKAQKILMQASCIGNVFELNMISKLADEDPQVVLKEFRLAIKYDLVMYFKGSFYFSHDKILEALNSKLSEDERIRIHINIAKLMLADKASVEERLESIYDIVDHFNHGIGTLSDPDRLLLIELNQQAGLKAKASTAYKNAKHYYHTAEHLLVESDWENNYSLAYDVIEGVAKVAYVSKNIEKANTYCQMLITKANNPTCKAKIYNILVDQYLHLSRVDEAIDSLQQGLKAIHTSVNINPGKLDLIKEFLLLKSAFFRYKFKIEDLSQFNKNTNPAIEICTKMLYTLIAIAHNTGRAKLLCLLSMRIIRLSLKHGLVDETHGAFLLFSACLNWTYNSNRDNYYSDIALKIKATGIDTIRQDYIYVCWVLAWKQPWFEIPQLIDNVISTAYSIGCLTWIAYSLIQALFYEPIIDLKNIHDCFDKYKKIYNDVNHKHVSDSIHLHEAFWLTFINPKVDKLSFNQNNFSEVDCLKRMKDIQYHSGIAYYYLFKLIIAFEFEEYDQASKYYKMAATSINGLLGMTWLVEFKMLEIFILLEQYKHSNFLNKSAILYKYRKALSFIERWANNCPKNFSHLTHIVKAEYLSKVCNQHHFDLYDKAISQAQNNKLYRYAALFAHLAGKTALATKQMTVAKVYFERAVYLYQIWGAKEKVRFLKNKYLRNDFNISNALLTRTNKGKIENSGYDFDLDAVISSSQAISSETNFKKLVKKIINIIVQHACVQKCYLVMEEDDMSLVIPAYTNDSKSIHVKTISLHEKSDELSLAIVNYVKHSRRHIIRYHDDKDTQFNSDIYLKNNNPHFILCMPILKNKKLIAILYLENVLAENTFTEERLAILKMLATQAAISLDTTLYFQKKAEEQIKKHQLELAHYSKLATVGEMASSIAHEINQPLTSIVQYIGVCVEKLYAGDNDNIIEMMELVESETERAGNIIHQLKDFLKKDTLKKTLTDINSSINGIARLLLPRLKQSNISYHRHLDHASPIILADRIQLEQIIFNLFMNAIESIETSNKNARDIDVRTTYQDKLIYITITDNGVGIKPEIQEKIFTPFFSTKSDGMGMGLNICRSIIENHNGKFSFQSDSNQTVFTIILPGE